MMIHPETRKLVDALSPLMNQHGVAVAGMTDLKQKYLATCVQRSLSALVVAVSTGNVEPKFLVDLHDAVSLIAGQLFLYGNPDAEDALRRIEARIAKQKKDAGF